MKNKTRVIRRIALAAVLAALFGGCGAKNKSTGQAETNIKMSMSAPMAIGEYDMSSSYDGAVSSYGAAADTQAEAYAVNDVAGTAYDPGMVAGEDKIIMTGDIYIETDEFDAEIAGIRSLIAFYDGYTSVSNMYQVTDSGRNRRRYTVTLKVPAANFSYAFDAVSKSKGLKSASQRQENVSERYSDISSRLDTRKIEEERLLGMIAKTTEVTELLGLERRLAQVRTDISLYESQIRNIDKLVAYSTINLTVYETDIAEAQRLDSFGDRLVNGFISSARLLLGAVQALTFAAALASAPLLALIVVAVIIMVIVKRVKRIKP